MQSLDRRDKCSWSGGSECQVGVQEIDQSGRCGAVKHERSFLVGNFIYLSMV
jgi:hypothetical protein